MFDVADSLRASLTRGRDELRAAQVSIARANSGAVPGRRADAAMAQTARAAIFSEALLTITHTRLAEIKAVAK